MRIVRPLAALGAMAGFVFTALVLLWSDRAGQLSSHGAWFVTRIGRRAEAIFGIDVIDRSDIPVAFDQLGHMALWFLGMVIFGWVGRRHVPLWLTATLVAGASLLSEAGQAFASTSRDTSITDAFANLAGVGLGVAALTTVLSVQVLFAAVSRSDH